MAHCIRSIQELVSLGVRFLAVTQNLDTDESNPMSRFLLHILAAFAEQMIRERVRSGLRAAQANGKALGRPRRVFRRDEAARLRSQGASWRKIAQTLGLPNVYGDRRLKVPPVRLVPPARRPVMVLMTAIAMAGTLTYPYRKP